MSDISDAGESNFLKQLSFLFLAFLCLLSIFKYRTAWKNDILYSIKKSFPAAVVLLFCAASSLWSELPMVSIKRFAQTILIFMASFVFIKAFGLHSFFNDLKKSLIILIFLSILSVLLHPNAIHGFNAAEYGLIGSWKGIFIHKNIAGSVAAILCGFLFFSFLQERNKKNFFIFCVTLFFLYMTKSKTSLSLFLLIAPVIVVFNYIRLGFKVYVFMFLCFLVFLFFLRNHDLITSLLLEDDFLTGRGLIWATIVEIIKDYPLFGVGISSVFHTPEPSVFERYASGWVALSAHAHNGYLEVMLYIGLIGFIIFFLFFISPIAKWLFYSRRYLSLYESRVCIFIFLFFMVHNISESSFLVSKVGWFFLSILFVASSMRGSHAK